MSFLQQASRGVKWTSLAAVLAMVLQFAQLAVLGRILTPSDFGLVAMIMVVLGFVQAYADMGISNALIYRQDATYSQLSSLYWLNLMVGALLYGVVILVNPLVISFFGESRLVTLIPLAALALVITPIGQQFQVLCEKELRFNRLAAFEIIASILGTSIAITTAMLGWGVVAIIAGQLAASSTKALSLAVYGFRRWSPALHFQLSDVRDFLGFGLYQLGERSISYMSKNLDKLLVGSLLGSLQLGYYNIAYQLMIKPSQVINPIITRVTFPLFAKLQGDDPALKKAYLEAIQSLAIITFPIYTAMILLAKPLILGLMGPEWGQSVSIFQILSALGFIYVLGNPMGSLQLAKGRADIGFFMTCYTALIYGGAIWFGSRFGTAGVATGLLIATLCFQFPVGFWLRWKLVKMSPLEYFQTLLPPIASAAIMALFVRTSSFVLDIGDQDAFSLGGIALLGGFLYLAAIYKWQPTFILLLRKSIR